MTTEFTGWRGAQPHEETAPCRIFSRCIHVHESKNARTLDNPQGPVEGKLCKLDSERSCGSNGKKLEATRVEKRVELFRKEKRTMLYYPSTPGDLSRRNRRPIGNPFARPDSFPKQVPTLLRSLSRSPFPNVCKRNRSRS